MKKQNLFFLFIIVSSLTAMVHAASPVRNRTYFAEKPSLLYSGFDFVGAHGDALLAQANAKKLVKESEGKADYLTYDFTKKKSGTGYLSVTGFYTQSHSDKELAGYFGNTVNGIKVSPVPDFDNSITVESGKDLVKAQRYKQLAALVSPEEHLWGVHIDHAPGTVLYVVQPTTMSGTLTLNPQRREWGARFGYTHRLDTLFPGLTLSASVPFVSVTHAMDTTVLDRVASDYSNQILDNGSDKLFITDYFVTGFGDTGNYVIQNKMTHGLVAAKHTEKTGIADINLRADCPFYIKKKYMLSGGLSLTIPMGNKSTGKYLYEAIVGNNNHYGFGLHGDAQIFIKRIKDVDLTASCSINYQYLLPADEIRTFGLQVTETGSLLPGGHYNVLVEDGKNEVTPGTNVLTRTMRVAPGHQYGGTFGLQGTWKGMQFDIGYSLLVRDEENVSVAQQWDDDRYAIASPWFIRANATSTEASVKTMIEEHGDRIGALSALVLVNPDGGAGIKVPYDASTVPAGSVPGESGEMLNATSFWQPVSVGGPIQTSGTASSLPAWKRGADPGDGSNVPNVPRTTAPLYQESRYSIAPQAATTPRQVTHTIIFGANYPVLLIKPLLLSFGGQYEFGHEVQTRASWSLWGKVGLRF